MTKLSAALTSLPPEATRALATLGEQLALARLRRKESQRQWAARIGVSVPTLARMERGDASVSAGIYATALWMMGRTQALANLADPAHDLGALEADVRAARQIRAARTQASIKARLAKAGSMP